MVLQAKRITKQGMLPLLSYFQRQLSVSLQQFYRFLHSPKMIRAQPYSLCDSGLAVFADIAGFTAWSSVREPAQVFTLLESLYGAFDKIAHRRKVFKVETVGDSYVAVCGLPEPRKDHALVMAKFARDCREKVDELTKELARTLGPDTAELQIRTGLNSGREYLKRRTNESRHVLVLRSDFAF